MLVLGTCYGIRYWWLKGRPLVPFQSALIRTDTATLTTLSIQLPQTQELLFTRDQLGWLVADGLNSTRISAAEMSPLLQALVNLTSLGMLSQEKSTATYFGVTPEQGTRVKLFVGSDLREDFLLGFARPDTAFFRFATQPDVFAIPRANWDAFQVRFSQFRNPDLLAGLSVSAPNPDSVYFLRNDSLVLCLLRLPNGAWARATNTNHNILTNNWWTSIATASDTVFAEDFDEMAANRLPAYQLTFFQGGVALFTLECLIDNQRSLPFLWRTNLRPQLFFAGDSTGWYDQWITPLDSLASDTLFSPKPALPGFK